MAITDELRKWADDNTVRGEVVTTFPAQHPVHGTVESLLRIADRIDTAHEHGMEERADRYSELRAEMNNCYIELPKDADGEYIHVGDEMETLISPFEGEHCAVEYLTLLADGWEVDGDAPTSMRHYRKPTVEDVLREFFVYAERGKEHHSEDVDDAVLAQYAAKLRLAGDAE